MTITEDLQIRCPPATAFDVLADVRNETQWNADVSKAELTTDEPIGQGSRFITEHGKFPLLRPMIRRGMVKQHQNLKALCESQAQ